MEERGRGREREIKVASTKLILQLYTFMREVKVSDPVFMARETLLSHKLRGGGGGKEHLDLCTT